MKKTPLTVFILGEHALVVNGLRHRIKQKFGSAVEVKLFCDVHLCLRSVDKDTDVLVLDEHLEGRRAGVWGSHFRAINPQVEVLRHDSEDHVLAELSTMLRQKLVPEAAAVFALV